MRKTKETDGIESDGKETDRKEHCSDKKRKSITGMMKRRGRKERNNGESVRGKVSNQGDAKRRSYSEALIEGALRTERVFMGDSI